MRGWTGQKQQGNPVNGPPLVKEGIFSLLLGRVGNLDCDSEVGSSQVGGGTTQTQRKHSALKLKPSGAGKPQQQREGSAGGGGAKSTPKLFFIALMVTS